MNISLFVQLLWGFPKRFLLLGRTLASKRGFKPNTEVQVLAPPTTTYFENLTVRLHVLYALNTYVKFCVN